MKVKQLSCKAPRREPVKSANGWWTRPWTSEGMKTAIAGGAWFKDAASHDFA